MGRRRCCCCEEVIYSLCGTMDDIHLLFQEDEEIGTWATDPGPPCVLIESTGTGQMIGGNETGRYAQADFVTQNVQDADEYSIILRWSLVDGVRTWLEFRYTRDSSTQVTLAWYLHVDEVESELGNCTAVVGVWPYPQLGYSGDRVGMHACISPVKGSDPPEMELYGQVMTGSGSMLRLWVRTSTEIAATDPELYYAGFAIQTPTHNGIVEYFSHGKIISGDPRCQCYRTCDCTDDVTGAVTVYPPAKLMLTYIGYSESGEDDCTSLTGITIILELVPCGGEVTWVGYTDENSGCLQVVGEQARLKYTLTCPSQPFPTDPDWFSSPIDWRLVIEQEEFIGSPPLHKMCIAPYGFISSFAELFSVEPSTCNPFVLVFEYGPGVTWPEDGMYGGFFPENPLSNCPDACAPCGNSLVTEPDHYFHIHWKCIVTEAT